MNIGKNRGSLMRPALKLFSSRLLKMVSARTGMSYDELDEALGFDTQDAIADRCRRYVDYKNSRAPKRTEIQDLENRVAKLLGREPFRVRIRCITERPMHPCQRIYERGDHMDYYTIKHDEGLDNDSPMHFKSPRTSRDAPRLKLCLEYEGIIFFAQASYGKNYPPPMKWLLGWRYAIESYDFESDPTGAAEGLAKYRVFINQYLDPTVAGILPEWKNRLQ